MVCVVLCLCVPLLVCLPCLPSLRRCEQMLALSIWFTLFITAIVFIFTDKVVTPWEQVSLTSVSLNISRIRQLIEMIIISFRDIFKTQSNIKLPSYKNTFPSNILKPGLVHKIQSVMDTQQYPTIYSNS